MITPSRRTLLASAALTPTALLLPACTITGGAADATGRTLVLAQSNDILSSDPQNHSNVPTGVVLSNIFEFLVRPLATTEGIEFEPWLATAWEQIDETTWEFTLREGVTFHDGSPFSADDVAFTVERNSTDPDVARPNVFETVDSVEVVDPVTVRFHLTRPDPTLLNLLGVYGASILSKKQWDEVGTAGLREQPLGTGPYRWDRWVKDDRLVLAPYDGYWGEPPIWDGVEFRAIVEDSTRVAEVAAGSVDIASNIPPESDDLIASSGNASTLPFDNGRVIQLFLRTTGDRPTADPEVRRALDLAIDSVAIAEQIVPGLSVPTRSLIAPGLAGFDEQYFDTQLHDPEEARSILATAGYTEDTPLELTLNTPHGRYLKDREIAEAVAGYWEAVGVTVNLEVLDFGVLNERKDADTLDDVFLFGVGGASDGALTLRTLLTGQVYSQHTGFSDARFDELITAALEEGDADTRDALIREAHEIVLDSRPRLAILQSNFNYGVSDRVEFSPRLNEYIWVDRDVTPR